MLRNAVGLCVLCVVASCVPSPPQAATPPTVSLPKPTTRPSLAPTLTSPPVASEAPHDLAGLPDGQYLLTWSPSLLHVWSQDAELLRTIPTRAARPPAISHSGSMIAIDLPGLEVSDLSSGQTVELDSALAGYSPSWSPDDSLLAFIAVPDGPAPDWISALAVVDPTADTMRRLTFWDAAEVSAPSWSPDGKWIAFASDHGRDSFLEASDIYLYDASCIDTPEECVLLVRQLTEGSEVGGADEPSWSPDSTRLAFVCGIPEDVRICVADATGAHVETFSSGLGTPSSPTWSPDANLIAFNRGFTYPPFDRVSITPATGGPEIIMSQSAGQMVVGWIEVGDRNSQ